MLGARGEPDRSNTAGSRMGVCVLRQRAPAVLDALLTQDAEREGAVFPRGEREQRHDPLAPLTPTP